MDTSEGDLMIRCRFTNISMRRITLSWGIDPSGRAAYFVEPQPKYHAGSLGWELVLVMAIYCFINI